MTEGKSLLIRNTGPNTCSTYMLNKITPHNVCAAHREMFSTLGGGGGYHMYNGEGGVQYAGDTMSTLGDSMMSVGDIMSTPGDVQYSGVSIQIQLFSQWSSSTFIMISQCTHDIPHCTEYPPLYCIFSGVLHRHYPEWECSEYWELNHLAWSFQESPMNCFLLSVGPVL